VDADFPIERGCARLEVGEEGDGHGEGRELAGRNGGEASVLESGGEGVVSECGGEREAGEGANAAAESELGWVVGINGVPCYEEGAFRYFFAFGALMEV